MKPPLALILTNLDAGGGPYASRDEENLGDLRIEQSVTGDRIQTGGTAVLLMLVGQENPQVAQIIPRWPSHHGIIHRLQ
jgi:hypothetical protein